MAKSKKTVKLTIKKDLTSELIRAHAIISLLCIALVISISTNSFLSSTPELLLSSACLLLLSIVAIVSINAAFSLHKPKGKK